MGLADDVQNTMTSVDSMTVLSDKTNLGGEMTVCIQPVARGEKRRGATGNSTTTDCGTGHSIATYTTYQSSGPHTHTHREGSVWPV